MAKKERQTKKSGAERASLYIVGESPLVEEYGTLAESHGYDVTVQWNEQPAASSATDFHRSATVPSQASLALELTNTDITAKRRNIEKLEKALPPSSAILSSSITVSVSQQATWIQARHRLAGFAAFPGFSEKPLVELAPTVFTPAETIEVALKFFRSLGKEAEIVQDRVGMVAPRILCQIINEAAFALQEDVASPADIDTAMKLGVNYPLGPIEWADAIGFKNVYAVLDALEHDLREDRYRIAPLLKQMAESGEWWKPSQGRKS